MKATVCLLAMVIALACCKPKEKLMTQEAATSRSNPWMLW